MVESEAQQLPEAVMLGAVVYGHEQMQTAIQAINEPTLKKRLTDQGMEIVANTPEEFTAFQAREYARWKTLIEARKISID